jgi:chemotaxis response regulator CheB
VSDRIQRDLIHVHFRIILAVFLQPNSTVGSQTKQRHAQAFCRKASHLTIIIIMASTGGPRPVIRYYFFG